MVLAAWPGAMVAWEFPPSPKYTISSLALAWNGVSPPREPPNRYVPLEAVVLPMLSSCCEADFTCPARAFMFAALVVPFSACSTMLCTLSNSVLIEV